MRRMTPVDVVIVVCALVGFAACATTFARAAAAIARGSRRSTAGSGGSTAQAVAAGASVARSSSADAVVDAPAVGFPSGLAAARAAGTAHAGRAVPATSALPDAASCVRALVIGAAMLAAMLAAHALAPLGVAGSDVGLVSGLGLVALSLAAAAHARRGMTRAALDRLAHGGSPRLAGSGSDLDAACLHDVLGCALSGIVLVVGHGLLHAHGAVGAAGGAGAASALAASGHAHSAGLPAEIVLVCLAVLAAAFAAWTLVLARGRCGIRLVELLAMGAMPVVMVAGMAAA